MNNLSDDPRNGTACLSRAGLAIGDGAKTGPAIVAPNGAGIDYCIKGLAYHKADAATVLPLTAAAAQDVSTKCLYLIQINAAGTVSSVKGREVLTADLTAGNDVLEWPMPSDDTQCPIGAVKIETAAATTFTAGTTALDAAGITETYYNICLGVPIEGLTS